MQTLAISVHDMFQSHNLSSKRAYFEHFYGTHFKADLTKRITHHKNSGHQETECQLYAGALEVALSTMRELPWLSQATQVDLLQFRIGT